MPTKESMSEQFYSQVSESIKLVFDLTSRIDERVKMLAERQNDVEERLDRILDLQQSVGHRVTVLETKDNSSAIRSEITSLNHKVLLMENQSKDIVDLKESNNLIKNKLHLIELRLESLHLKDTHHDRRWATAFDFVFRLAFVVLGGYLLYKLGIQSPPTP